ncbi:MAG: hypothetical protein H0U27_04885 [Nitrosopumilus sp.]|nr:hypothetical protein [Nitrosopumilus sp.]
MGFVNMHQETIPYETASKETDCKRYWNVICQAKKNHLETINEFNKREDRKSPIYVDKLSLKVELATAKTMLRIEKEHAQKKINTFQSINVKRKDLMDQANLLTNKSLMLKNKGKFLFEQATRKQQQASQLHQKAQSSREQIAKKMMDNTDKLIVALNSRINNLSKANDFEKNKALLDKLNNLIKTGEGLKAEIQPTKIALESVKPKLQKFGTECSAVLLK